jgi:bifunctional ADP-heptose synthase (sugar kinase/adenylyltransferase)
MNDVAKYFDTFLKVATTGALIVVALLGTRFVTKEEFRDANQRIEKIEAVLIRMEAQYETDKRHDALLADHESRLRTLEKN